MQDDVKTWQSFCDGDDVSFRDLYSKYYTRLFVWGCRWLDGETAFVKDSLHDFFIYLWEKKDNLSRDVHVDKYLLTAFKRRLIEQWGKVKRLDNITDYINLSGEELDEQAIFDTRYSLIQTALQQLTPAQREVIEWRFIKHMSLQEIADAKNTSLRTVYNLTHRAIAQLRASIGKKNILFLW
ncbi:RNA polymerase sigma factor (sigma-70 family) [Chitinophaga skermanii]|uniref:RNA polymerase sigma factor (Sigma-70 family) n=1 Tax=Chitinophaga skermanii TaxID=331697 RepID=A0A327QWL1_9BACT|nr:sigma-70 family RNA polymerase sigma factor [Chitinophaga skermanii]RAJ08335.1 RNA polymerase sigma factor (sigma-70 family) [Chitinophaga skermanii]